MFISFVTLHGMTEDHTKREFGFTICIFSTTVSGAYIRSVEVDID
jgi:hypothetical protein